LWLDAGWNRQWQKDSRLTSVTSSSVQPWLGQGFGVLWMSPLSQPGSPIVTSGWKNALTTRKFSGMMSNAIFCLLCFGLAVGLSLRLCVFGALFDGAHVRQADAVECSTNDPLPYPPEVSILREHCSFPFPASPGREIMPVTMPDATHPGQLPQFLAAHETYAFLGPLGDQQALLLAPAFQLAVFRSLF